MYDLLVTAKLGALAAIAELKKTLIAKGEELMIRLVEHFILLKAYS